MKTRFDYIKEALSNTADENLVAMYDCYKGETSASLRHDGYVFGMDEFAAIFSSEDPWELVRKAHFGHFNPTHKWFMLNECENLDSFDELDDPLCPIDIDTIAKYADTTEKSFLRKSDIIVNAVSKYDNESKRMIEGIKELLDNLSYSDLATLWNDYRFATEATYTSRDLMFEMDLLDSILCNETPSEILRKAHYGEFSYSDSWFSIDGAENLVSFNHPDDPLSPVDYDELAEFISTDDHAFSNLESIAREACVFDEYRDVFEA